LHERPAWLAEVPIEKLANGTYPKLVLAGAWDLTGPGYLPGMGDVMQLVGRTVAAKIGAEYREIPGAAHEAHKEQPEVVNRVLDAFWRTGKMAG
jgi:pimeloyl-ACP methyl ester carboxylesterase